MLHAYVRIFDVTDTVGKFSPTKTGLIEPATEERWSGATALPHLFQR